ncbi:MAG: S9 family peptidase [Crocinitomicaceae bacterium]|nr:MAG: S9 family peptidase [Crocinitomicaceae bacterium]
MLRIRIICTALLVATLVSSAGFSQSTLTPELLWKLKRLSGGKVSPDGKKILFELREFDIAANRGNTDLFVFDIASNSYSQITQTPQSEMEATWGKNNKIWFLQAVSDGLHLFTMNADGSSVTQVTPSGLPEIEGFKLSPDESKIVFIVAVKAKETLREKHPDLPLANARLEDDLMYRHWNQWADENKKHLFLHEIKNNSVERNSIDLLQGEAVDGILPPFGGSDQVVFSPDSKRIIYSCKKKVGKEFALSTNSDLFEFTIETRTTIRLTENYKGYDANARFSPSGKLFAWNSMAHDGFESDKNDIIVRNLSAGVDVNITAKADLTVEEFLFSSDEKVIFFLAPMQGTKQLFSIDLKTNAVKQLTFGQFDLVSMDLAPTAIIACRQSMIEPTDLYSISLKKFEMKRLTEVNKSILENVRLPKVEEKWVETTDGQKMLVWMVLPPDFDPNQKYPALLYCQGGPQSMVSQFFSYRWNLALMASQGYVVVAPNRRGLPGFGQKWNDAISKDWGGQSIQDYLSAIDFAAKETYVDASRMGAVGASYGGYSVYYLAGKHAGRFKTFVSHCGLFNLESWYGTTEELFFANWDNKGPYWLNENKEYYAKNSPHNFVQNWDTPMLVIHGGMDFRVPESEGMQAFQAAQLKGLRSKYLLFPKEGHWITTPQNGILWFREFFEWLETDLKR